MNGCPHCAKISRREWLRGLGTTAAFTALARSGEAQVASSRPILNGRASSCVFINLDGGPSHVETFDFKLGPWTPSKFEPRQLPTGLVLSSRLFPKLSGHAADLCVLRSVSAWENAHPRGQFYLQTGHPQNPAFAAETPHIGSVVALEKGGGVLPGFLSLNGSGPGAAFLSPHNEPFRAGSRPQDVDGINLRHELLGVNSPSRFQRRVAMLRRLDATNREAGDPATGLFVTSSDAALRMMYDPAVAGIFKITDEDESRYGSHDFGRACAIARNVIQAKAGPRFISITQKGWDLHNSQFVDHPSFPSIYTLAGELDAGVASLIDDLKQSDRFRETLIVLMGEFGRTPGPLNSFGGRDHYSDAMSVVMLGAGIGGGRIVGATDSTGSAIVEYGWSQQRPIRFEDLTATIYSALGINWTKALTDTPSGRTFEYVPYAQYGAYRPVEEVFR